MIQDHYSLDHSSPRDISKCLKCHVPVQALDGAFNQENREKCKAATGPLIEAVDNLTAFASNPEFASIPAQISPKVCPRLNRFNQ